MSVGRSQLSTQHPDQPNYSRLVWALVISLSFHGGGYGIYQIERKYHFLEKIHLPQWIQKITQAIVPPIPKQPPPPREAPLMYVEVNPANAVTEPPKNAKYYASQSTHASNPDPNDTDVPKISGAQEQVMRTEDTQLSKAQPLQPAPAPTPAPTPKPEPPQEEAKPKPTLRPGDLTMVRPEDQLRKTEGDAPKPKPRTVAEAKARLGQQRPATAGERSKQDGGVSRLSVKPALDAIGSPFGVYDSAMIAAIQERWFYYLEQRAYAGDGVGKVVIKFRLHSSGRVTDVEQLASSVDELLSSLCRLAITDNSPYARWPSDMRLQNDKDYRDLTFTFFYN